MQTWCHLSRSVIPLLLAEREEARFWSMKSATNTECVTAAGWRWGLTHRKQSGEDLEPESLAPLGVGICRAVWHRLEFCEEQRAEGRLPLHKTSQMNSEVHYLSFMFPHYILQAEMWSTSRLQLVILRPNTVESQQRWHDARLDISKGLLVQEAKAPRFKVPQNSMLWLPKGKALMFFCMSVSVLIVKYLLNNRTDFNETLRQ